MRHAVNRRSVIFLPVFLYNNHWTCIVCNLLTGSMTFYDSLLVPDSPKAEVLFKKLRKLFLAACDPDQASYLPTAWTTKIAQGPYQVNGDDCGVYVCLAMKASVLGIPFRAQAAEIDPARASILKSFIEWSEEHSDHDPESLTMLRVEDNFEEFVAPTLTSLVRRNRGKGVSEEPIIDLTDE